MLGWRLREGGFYLTREGKPVGPIFMDQVTGKYTVKGRPASHGWYPDGFRGGKQMPDDLVHPLMPSRWASFWSRVLRGKRVDEVN